MTPPGGAVDPDRATDADERRGSPVVLGALGLAAAVAIAWRGGYANDARGAVVAAAALAALMAAATAPGAFRRALRHPVVLALGAVAAITAASAAWTIGAPSDAVRDAAAVLALAAVVAAAATVPGPWPHAVLILVAALAASAVGLAALGATDEPRALLLCGAWRPAGPFEYPPALALVCAGALPVGLAGMTTGRRWLAAGGALAGWMLALCIALTGNRTGIALGGAALVAAVALSPGRGGMAGAGAGAIVLCAGTSAVLLGDAPERASAMALVLAAVPAVALAGAWPWARTQAAGRRRWLGAAVAVIAVACVAAVAADRAGPCGADPAHGRLGIWRAAVHTATDRPVLGSGAGTFLLASREHQRAEGRVPTRFAHDLPLETWVELGIGGVAAVLAWYAAVLLAAWRAPRRSAALLAPALLIFPLANLLDWPWELLGVGVLWAIAAGGVIGGGAVTRTARGGG